MVVNAGLWRALEIEYPDASQVKSLLEQARDWRIAIDPGGLRYLFDGVIERLATRLRGSPLAVLALQELEAMVGVTRTLPFEVDLWKAQNVYYELLSSVYPPVRRSAAHGDREAQAWAEAFASLGQTIGVDTGDVLRAPGVADVLQELLTATRIPAATYRLQFNQDFRFADAQALAAYLDDLGVTDCYTSPLQMARPGSSHGYDIVDHGRLNPDYGGEEGFLAFSSSLRKRGMGLILDVVSNHMSIAGDSNAWWMDVLENGPSSQFASYFDINWEMSKPEMQDRVLLPILEDQFGRVLENGRFRLVYDDGAFFVYHYETKLPVEPASYARILEHRLDRVAAGLGDGHEHLLELRSILTALGHLPGFTDRAAERIAERSREKEVIKRRIASLYGISEVLRAALEQTLRVFNGNPSDAASFDLLGALLDVQAYRLSYWRVATDEINYRRFFDINEMAGIRVELEEVFDASHELILRLMEQGQVTGLRIDHPDGLWDPSSYFRKVQQRYLVRAAVARLGEDWRADVESAVEELCPVRGKPLAPSDHPPCPFYIVVEKILLGRETLPDDWTVQGTTGYDFLNLVNGLFVNGAHRGAFDALYAGFARERTGFRDLTNSTRKVIMVGPLASEINSLSNWLERVLESNRRYRDFTLNSLNFGIREIIACLAVYRTYINSLESGPSPRDQAYIRAAVAEARKRNPRMAVPVFEFVQDVLLLRALQDFRTEDWGKLTDFVMRFQQLTGPVMAKGVEDTAFYVYNRLASLNEVGGSPDEFGVTVRTFHSRNAQRGKRWPHSLLATSTHDTKRSEDVRARINVLSEMPREWRSAVGRWSRLNARHRTAVEGEPSPDRNDEYLLYQTLVGAWPDGPLNGEGLARFTERIVTYMLKATKEAKVHTSWVNPYTEYDAAVEGFVRRILADKGNDAFLASFRPFQSRVATYGRYNSLSQTLLKLTSPGVPDIYQGTELWDYSLVDPDNRRPVDYQRRISLLSELMEQVRQSGDDLAGLAEDLLRTCEDGRVKLYVVYRGLGFRRAHRRLFSAGEYIPLEAAGEKSEHACAFARVLDGEAAVVVVPRLVVGLTRGSEAPPLGAGVWKDTHLVLPPELAGRTFRNVFTGEELPAEGNSIATLPLAAVLARFPVALLEGRDE